MPRALPLVLCVVLVAGCAGGNDANNPDPDVDTSDRADGSNASAYSTAPVWNVGQWWQYEGTAGSESSEATLVVTADGRAEYVVDTTNRSQAVFDAKNDISYIGPVAKGDLSGRQGGTPVRFFQFPLEADQEWSTTWDDETRLVRALGVTDGEFQLEAAKDENVRVRYSLHSEAGFFGRLEFLDDAGEPTYIMRLSDWGDGFAETFVRASVQVIHEWEDDSFGAPTTDTKDFAVGPEVSELNFRFHVRCPDAADEWSFHYYPKTVGPDFAGDGLVGSTCPPERAANFTIQEPEQGDWVYAAQRFFRTSGSWSAELEARSYEDLTIGQT